MRCPAPAVRGDSAARSAGWLVGQACGAALRPAGGELRRLPAAVHAPERLRLTHRGRPLRGGRTDGGISGGLPGIGAIKRLGLTEISAGWPVRDVGLRRSGPDRPVYRGLRNGHVWSADSIRGQAVRPCRQTDRPARRTLKPRGPTGRPIGLPDIGVDLSAIDVDAVIAIDVDVDIPVTPAGPRPAPQGADDRDTGGKSDPAHQRRADGIARRRRQIDRRIAWIGPGAIHRGRIVAWDINHVGLCRLDDDGLLLAADNLLV